MKYRYGVARQPTHSLPFRDPRGFLGYRRDPFKLSLKGPYSFPSLLSVTGTLPLGLC